MGNARSCLDFRSRLVFFNPGAPVRAMSVDTHLAGLDRFDRLARRR